MTNKGERVVTEPDIQGNTVVFVSQVPETNPCLGGGYSWINALDLRSGSRLTETPFDYNLDGSFGESDLLTVSGTPQAGSSIRLTGFGGGDGVYTSPMVAQGIINVGTSESNVNQVQLYNAEKWRVWEQLR